MKERSLLYFALGVLTVTSFGAVTNQVLSMHTPSLALSDTGITFPDGTVQTTAASADPRRAFYLTDSVHTGAQALTACTAGFHMASLWEILDVSNLRYTTNREGGNDVRRAADSGVGAVSGQMGWIRTGLFSSSSDSEGLGNCSAWTSADLLFSGTAIMLQPFWGVATGGGDPSVVIAPWDSDTFSCDVGLPVWCAED